MEKHVVKSSLRSSFWDGVFAACMMGLTQEYFTPYALALNARPPEIAALTAWPNVANAFSQLRSFTLRIWSRKSEAGKKLSVFSSSCRR